MLIWWISYSRQIVARGGITWKVLQVPPPDMERRPMPVSFLTEQQRHRYGLNHFSPVKIRYFFVSAAMPRSSL